jgi:catechol 2,3-dioxygenase-like lactoylglutathione lyase family enzyme
MAKGPTTALLPRFHQLGYVVADLAEAMSWWSSVLGVGPFFVSQKFTVPDFLFRGRPSAPTITLALSHWGDQQIELIQQHNDAPSGYSAFMAVAPGGLQHLAYWSDDIAADLANCRAAGLRIQHEGGSPVNDGTRFYYLEGADLEGADLEGAGHPGAVIELIDMNPAKHARFARIAEIAVAWDGRDAVRPLASLG